MRGIDRYDKILFPMNRWLAQLGLVAPGGPLKDKNIREAVTVLEPISAKSIKIVYFGSSDSFCQILHERRWH